MLTENRFLDGWVKGDFQASIASANLADSWVKGDLRGRGLLGHRNPWLPLSIDAFVISGKAHRLFVDWADLTLAEMPLTLSGRIDFASQDGPKVDMTVSADSLNMSPLVRALRAAPDTTNRSVDKRFARLPVQGRLRLKADRFVLDELTWAPLRANIAFDDDAIKITVSDAVLCGISTPGTLRLAPDNVH